MRKNVAIFADNASDYAKGLAASFKETIEANGGTVVAEEAYVAKDVDFKSQLTNIKGKILTSSSFRAITKK